MRMRSAAPRRPCPVSGRTAARASGVRGAGADGRLKTVASAPSHTGNHGPHARSAAARLEKTRGGGASAGKLQSRSMMR